MVIYDINFLTTKLCFLFCLIAATDINTDVLITSGETTIRNSFNNSFKYVTEIKVNSLLIIESNQPVSCAIVYKLQDTSKHYHVTFRYLSPVLLYHINHRVHLTSEGHHFSANILLAQSSFQHINFKSAVSNPFHQAMIFYSDFFICQNVALTVPNEISSAAANNAPFHGSVYGRTNSTAHEYPFAMRVTSIYSSCVPASPPAAHGGNGDGIDNDCDGAIDEETLNNVDDDNDGLIDEDIRYVGHIPTHQGMTAWEYHVKNQPKATSGVPTNVISIIISIGVALAAVLIFIGGMLLADKIRRSTSGTRVMPIF